MPYTYPGGNVRPPFSCLPFVVCHSIGSERANRTLSRAGVGGRQSPLLSTIRSNDCGGIVGALSDPYRNTIELGRRSQDPGRGHGVPPIDLYAARIGYPPPKTDPCPPSRVGRRVRRPVSAKPPSLTYLSLSEDLLSNSETMDSRTLHRCATKSYSLTEAEFVAFSSGNTLTRITLPLSADQSAAYFGANGTALATGTLNSSFDGVRARSIARKCFCFSSALNMTAFRPSGDIQMSL